MSIPEISAGTGNVFLGEKIVAEGGCGIWKPGANTLVYYNINDNDTNSTIYDLSGNSNNVSGTITYGMDATAGKVFTSGRPTRSIINFGNEFTFITRCYPTGISSGMACVFSNGASASTYASNALNYNIARTVGGWCKGDLSHGGDEDVVTTDTISLNNWCMLALTRDINKNLKIYINGGFSKSATLTWDPVYPNNTNFMLGGWGGGGNTWNGKIKTLIGENRTWTINELALYYNQTKSLYGIS